MVVRLGARWFGIVAFVVGTVLLPGCGDDMPSPVAPTPIDPPGEGPLVLKVSTGPVPTEPKGGIEISDRQPLLVASIATGLVNVEFEHEFAVHLGAASSGSVPVDSGRGTRDGPATSYAVEEQLVPGEHYEWLVRASYRDPDTDQDAFGDWSEPARFSIAAVVFGEPPQLVSPSGSTVVGRPVFTVRQGEIEGEAEWLIEIRVAPEGTELTDAQVAGRTVTEARPGEEVTIELRADFALMPGETYRWQARAAGRTAGRTYRGPWSSPPASFTTTSQSLGAPEPSEPVRGETVGTRPTFAVVNGAVDGDVGPVTIRVEVAPDGNQDGVPDNAGFAGAFEGQAPMQGGTGSMTTIQLDAALDAGMSYVWRARAVAPQAPLGPVRSDWSSTARFATREGGDYPLGPVQDPPPNLRHIIQRVADAHPDALDRAVKAGIPGVPNGPNDARYEFLNLTVEALREANGGRWGTTFWVHPPHPDTLSKERVGYYLGNGDPVNSQNMRVIEFMVWADGSIAWYDSTHHIRTHYPNATGYWRHHPRHGTR